MATIRKCLYINGVEKFFICDDNETLADVLRTLGLTGTKVGCNKGICGACNVVLDGELVRACTRKISKVADCSKITTIEGLGTADNLHPLQLSWIVHGGVQCGFCTPGFIVSAKVLLDKNPSPTRAEVRHWFQEHKNACRCTGYKHLVDAVMDAAKVLRGEMTMDELAWKMPEDQHVIGTKLPRPTALSKVLGVCDYGDDIAVKSKGLLELAPVIPNAQHAKIVSVDYSEAEKATGVYKILTYKDVPGVNKIVMPLDTTRAKTDGADRVIFCEDKLFRNGDILCLVAADTREHARAAAALVKYELEPLPIYDNALDALADDAIEIHPGEPNILVDQPLQKGREAREVIAESAYSASGSFYTTRQSHLTIEPDVGQAYPDGDGGVTIQVKSHGIHMTQFFIGPTLNLPQDKIRIILNPTGGAFGYALSPGFPAMLGVAALACGCPVNLTLTAEEHMKYTGKRAASYSNGTMACDKDGKLTACEFEIAYDKGAFSEFSDCLVDMGVVFFGNPYSIPNISGSAKCVYSNQPYSTTYRGFGSPQVYTASEQLADMLAEKAGMDPFDFRYKNILREGDTGNTGNTFDVYPMQGILDKLRPKYEALKADAEKNSTPEKLRGVGVSCGVFKVGNPVDHSEIYLELNPDGSVTHYNAWEDIGQGGDVGALTQAYEALRPLGLTLDQIHLVMNDTKTCPPTGVAAGSRSCVFCGNATIDGAKKLLDAMRKPDGTYRTYDEMVAEGIPTKYTGVYDTGTLRAGLDRNDGHGNNILDYTYSAYASEVEIDVKTGKAKCIAMHCVADCGTVNNVLTIEGQAYGGMSHCIGFALTEDYQSPEKHGNIFKAGFPYIEDVPDGDDFTVEFIETKRPHGPWGCGGASEAFQSGGHVSILNAIYNAAGVRIYDLPAKPDKIKALMDAKAEGKEYVPEKYYLGDDLYEFLTYCRENPIANS